MKETKTPEEPAAEITYVESEVVDIMVTLGQVYAMDDAIYNQEQLRRPETYITPLRDVRNRIARHLTDITSKGKPPQPQPGTE